MDQSSPFVTDELLRKEAIDEAKKDLKSWNIIYPNYIDKSKKVCEGRRVGLEM